MNTLVFRLTATGESPPRVDPGELLDSEADVTWHYTHVYSSQIKWEPQGTQAERFAVPAGPVHDDILLAKLAPGQTIDVELHAVKGIGKDHAKFSPVATATYRLLPRISLDTETPFVGAEAEALVAACPAHVFDIEELGAPGRAGAAAAAAAAAPTTRARVARPRDCTLCRECIRKPEWTKRVKLERVTDHFICSFSGGWGVGGAPTHPHHAHLASPTHMHTRTHTHTRTHLQFLWSPLARCRHASCLRRRCACWQTSAARCQRRWTRAGWWTSWRWRASRWLP